MLPGMIAERICNFAMSRAPSEIIEEIRIGLCYSAVRTAGGATGLAAMLPYVAQDCRALDIRGYAGKKLSDFLWLLSTGSNPLQRSLGLACANAVLNSRNNSPEQDAIELMQITSADRVCMVGRFPPLVSRVEQAGAALSILEKDPEKGGILDPLEQQRCLKDCTVAIVTATTLLNRTMEDVFESLGSPRHVAVLGPSTPLCPMAFRDTPVNHLGGSIVKDPDQVMRIVSEAGGTPAMRPYLKFINLMIDRPENKLEAQ
jgi:hypothetical protein